MLTRRTWMFEGARALAVAAAPAFVATSPARGAEMRTLKVGANPSDDMTSVLYAVQSGIFTRVGLDVTLQRTTGSAGLAAAVAGGAYDIAKTSVSQLLAAHARGLSFKIVSPGAIYDNAHASRIGGFIVANGTPASGADFNGKTVSAIDLNGMSELALRAWVDKNGGDSSSLHFVELPMSAALGAVEQGRVFAAACANPYLASALASEKVRLIPAYGAIAPRFLFSTWVTTGDFLAKNPEVVRSFQQAVAQAATYTNAHPQETAQLLATASGIPLATIERMPRVENGTRVDAAGVQAVIDAAVKYKMLAKPFPASDIIA